MKIVFLISCLIISLFASAQTPIVTFKNPATVAKPTGYSHAAEIDLGKSKMLIISGQVALDAEGKVVGESDFARQTEQVFINIKNIIENSGGTLNDLVKITIYLRDVSNITKFREIRNKYINVENPPASTLVEITDLARDEFLVEVEATAVIPKVK
jgi:2-iminobutanoate/2-iminopropanoate deaminase